MDYHWGLAHYDRFKKVMVELFIFGLIVRPCWIRYLHYDLFVD